MGIIILLVSVVALRLFFCSSIEERSEQRILLREDNKILMIVSDDVEGTHCDILVSKHQIEEQINSEEGDRIELLTEEQMIEALDDCITHSLEGGKTLKRDLDAVSNEPAESSNSSFKIFPGTKWCGDGDIAANYDDLGNSTDTDKCCRTHDNCNDTIAAGESKYNLTNTSHFTALSCKCDNALNDCLSEVNAYSSAAIGKMYFNILKRQCYDWNYPCLTLRIEEVLKASIDEDIRRPTEDKIRIMLEVCNTLSLQKRDTSKEIEPRNAQRSFFILPGEKKG